MTKEPTTPEEMRKFLSRRLDIVINAGRWNLMTMIQRVEAELRNWERECERLAECEAEAQLASSRHDDSKVEYWRRQEGLSREIEQICQDLALDYYREFSREYEPFILSRM